MIRLIGAILICGGAASVGVMANSKLNLRVRVLSALVGALDTMQSEIYFMLTPLNEIMTMLSKASQTPVKQFFEDCSKGFSNIGELPFSLIWAHALKKADYLELTKQEQGILIELGGALGRYDAEEQARAIAHARSSLDSKLTFAEKEKQRLGKMYGVLSVACGIAVVIILI